jgi:alpha-galactosidase
LSFSPPITLACHNEIFPINFIRPIQFLTRIKFINEIKSFSGFLLVFAGLFCGFFAARAADPDYWSWAQTPPMGWNSWDGFATTVTETQARAQADFMAANLHRHGWEYIVVDIQWYEPNATGFDYRKDAKLQMDEWGRLVPATNKFPSAMNGNGFKPLADYVHSLGLKFGLHLMRGIPRQAVYAKTPIKGTAIPPPTLPTPTILAAGTAICMA